MSLNPAMLSRADVQNARMSKVSASFSKEMHFVFLKLQNETENEMKRFQTLNAKGLNVPNMK